MSNTCIFLFFPLDQYFITLIEESFLRVIFLHSVFDSFFELFSSTSFAFSDFHYQSLHIHRIYCSYRIHYFKVCRSKISQELKKIKEKPLPLFSDHLLLRKPFPQIYLLPDALSVFLSHPKKENFPYSLASRYSPLCVCSHTFLC